jgi:hypothetical protein
VKDKTSIIDILLNNFRADKTLREVGLDYEALQREIERERSANGEDSRRLAALQVVAQFQLQVLLRRLAETPDKGGESTVPAKQ